MFQMLTFGLYMFFMHPLHLGVIHLNIDERNKAQIEARLFTDDLESAIFHQIGKAYKIDYQDEESVEEVQKYLKQHLKVMNSAQNNELELVSVKPDRDVTVISYKGTIKDLNSLKVCCTIFFELFNDQTNLVIVKTPDIEEGFRLDQVKSCVIVKD